MRAARMIITYQGRDITRALQPLLLEASYTDHAGGLADDLCIRLRDDEGLWRGPWMPQEGDTVEASLAVEHWDREGDMRTLRLGSFQVDEIVCAGGPDTLEIKATSVFVSEAMRQELHDQGWEQVSLKAVAGELADRHKLDLDWQVSDTFPIERLDQRRESDLCLLDRLCRDRGLELKVHDGRLVIYLAKDIESRPAAMTIARGVSTLSGYRLTRRISGIYRACEMSWWDPWAWEGVATTFSPPGAPAVGQVLHANERVETLADAEVRAAALLREANREWMTGEIPLMGEPSLAAGVVVTLKGFGRFDEERWFVDKCVHSVGRGGYRTDLSIRKTLEY